MRTGQKRSNGTKNKNNKKQVKMSTKKKNIARYNW